MEAIDSIPIFFNDSHNITNLELNKFGLSRDCYNCQTLNANGILSHELEHGNGSIAREINDWSEFFGIMVTWQGILLVGIFCILIVVTIIGNTLVILAVTTTRRLKTVTNCFVMSLAIADLLVGIFVMPPAVAVHLKGSWQLGWILCDIWISLDVLLCTASILSLCAISVDRYLAVTQPIKYSRKRRSKRLALIMILIVWILALAITCPPMLGWYELGRNDLNECRYNQNEGYVIFSAMGSFFIPMAVMVYVYARISCVVASRHDNMTYINIYNKKLDRLSSKDAEVTLRRDIPEHDFSPRQNTHISELTNQAVSKEQDENILITKSNSHELTTSTLCNLSHKSQFSVASKNSTSFEHDYSLASLQQNNMATTTPLTNDYYITKNTRIYHQKSIPNRISLLTKENKTTQTLTIVMGGFIACWLPFFIYYLITPFLSKHQVSRTLANVLTWLGWFNSAINPFIYAFYNVDFRVAFWRLTLKRFFRNSPKAQFPSNTISIRR